MKHRRAFALISLFCCNFVHTAKLGHNKWPSGLLVCLHIFDWIHKHAAAAAFIPSALSRARNICLQVLQKFWFDSAAVLTQKHLWLMISIHKLWPKRHEYAQSYTLSINMHSSCSISIKSISSAHMNACKWPFDY